MPQAYAPTALSRVAALCPHLRRTAAPPVSFGPTTGQALHTLYDHTDPVYAVAFGQLPDGRTLLATASDVHPARIWDPATGPALQTHTPVGSPWRPAARQRVRVVLPAIPPSGRRPRRRPHRRVVAGVGSATTALVLEGIIYRYRCGLPWRDVPAEFGPWQTLWSGTAATAATAPGTTFSLLCWSTPTRPRW